MSESSPEEIAHVLAEQIATVREAKARLVKAMHIEREGARDRAKAETDIKAAHLVIAQLLRGSIGDEFIDVFRSIKR